MAQKSESDETFSAFDRYAKGEMGDEALVRKLDRIGAREDRQLENLKRRTRSPIGARARRFSLRR